MFWEVEDFDIFATFKQAGSQLLGCLVRCDDYADEADDYVVPPATKFSCVLLIKGEFFKFVVSQCALYTVITFVLDCLSVSSLCVQGADFSRRTQWAHGNSDFKQTSLP